MSYSVKIIMLLEKRQKVFDKYDDSIKNDTYLVHQYCFKRQQLLVLIMA